jgi:Sigma 54 modulation protein / S30EA ribosomal protein
MKIQVNSDKSIAVDLSLTRVVEGEVKHALNRFAARLTRVEVHLSDIDSRKNGQADKRCLIEARPAGNRPLSVSANATKLGFAISEAAGKMQRRLTTFLGRRGRRIKAIPARVSTPKKGGAKKTSLDAKKNPAARRAAVKRPKKSGFRGPKKKGIYQARRKPWPRR